MSCENIFKDICHIHARLFDHRSAFQGHINFLAKEFEEKRGDREKSRLDHMKEMVTQTTDHTLPTLHTHCDQHLTSINDSIKQMVELCQATVSNAKDSDAVSEFLQEQREARQGELDEFMKQQCVRSSRVDQEFEDNVELFHRTYEDLGQKLAEGAPLSSQTYYKFMALGKEFS